MLHYAVNSHSPAPASSRRNCRSGGETDRTKCSQPHGSTGSPGSSLRRSVLVRVFCSRPRSMTAATREVSKSATHIRRVSPSTARAGPTKCCSARRSRGHRCPVHFGSAEENPSLRETRGADPRSCRVATHHDRSGLLWPQVAEARCVAPTTPIAVRTCSRTTRSRTIAY